MAHDDQLQENELHSFEEELTEPERPKALIDIMIHDMMIDIEWEFYVKEMQAREEARRILHPDIQKRMGSMLDDDLPF